MTQEELYVQFHPKVLGYIRGKVSNAADAEDLASDVFVKVFAAMPGYDPKKSSLSTWIYTITRNRVIDYYRSQGNAPPRIGEDVSELAETLAAPETEDNDALLEQLYTGLKELPELYRAVVVLHYWDGLPHREVAERLGLTYTNAQKICSLALGRLRKAMLPA